MPPAAGTTGLAAVAREVQMGLARARYDDVRWFPIGARYQHGFAVTTKLEQVSSSRGSTAPHWLALYPEPVNLRWLTFAQAPSLPEPGRYRALLIAFTDLPLSHTTAAPVWNEETVMDGPGAPERRRVAPDIEGKPTADYRIGVFEYVYTWDEAAHGGAFCSTSNGGLSPGWPSALDGFVLPVNTFAPNERRSHAPAERRLGLE